jgi:hypothetical protein
MAKGKAKTRKKGKKKKKDVKKFPSESDVKEAISNALLGCDPPVTDVETAIPYEELVVLVYQEFDPQGQFPGTKVRELLDTIRRLVSGPDFQVTTQLRVYTA